LKSSWLKNSIRLFGTIQHTENLIVTFFIPTASKQRTGLKAMPWQMFSRLGRKILWITGLLIESGLSRS
jgi:hypothetical protein